MDETRITIIDGRCTVTTAEGQAVAGMGDIERFDAAVSQGRLLRFEFGGVIWYEGINDSNRHMLKAPPASKDPAKPERRGRPRGENYGKHVKRPGVGKGGNYRKPIPLNIVIALRERGLSGSEVARELELLGYPGVSRDYANRVTRGRGTVEQVDGRPRKK